ncbi:MAG: sugar ABC transporter permease [Armatimonadota bacterium]|nr:MAG: sugar ABC transporter permease [Armatimonadota bacterium]
MTDVATERSTAPRRGMTQADKKRLAVGLLFISPWIVGFFLFLLYPMASSFYYSLCRYPVLKPPEFIGLGNYARLIHDEYFWKALGNTAFMFIELPLMVVLGLSLALLLNQAVRGMPFFRTVFYLPAIVPIVASAMLWLWIYNPEYGLANVVLTKLHLPNLRWLVDPRTSKLSFIVMDTWAVGAGMIIYLASLQGVPEHLFEAAELDGAGAWHKLIHVILPSISPVVLFMVIMGMIGLFQYFTQAWIMTAPRGGPEYSTLFYALYLFQNGFEYFRMGYACAMAWILFAVILGATVLILKTSQRWVYYEESR